MGDALAVFKKGLGQQMIKKESVINAVKHWCKLTPIIR